MPRIYHADHTAHIRRRLRTETIRFSAGLLAAVLLAVGNGILAARLDGRHATLTAAVWWADGLLIIISLLGLALAGAQYVVYRRRRPDLDAAGAEAMGERAARLHYGSSD
ncbi:hypothetical protein [Actinoplanes sp. NPDC051859]|uniref:hypothetical protein n=1 Tax=Actinoplanes sp. NPDC051859 TaxID=3363909 RepID=UPI0037A9478C